MIILIISAALTILSIVGMIGEIKRDEDLCSIAPLIVFGSLFIVCGVLACDVLIYNDIEQCKYEYERETLIYNYNYVLNYEGDNILDLPSQIEMRTRINDFNKEILQKKADRKNLFINWMCHDIDIDEITITENGAI